MPSPYCSPFLPKKKDFSRISLFHCREAKREIQEPQVLGGVWGNAPNAAPIREAIPDVSQGAKRYLTPEQPVLSFKKLIVFPVLFENNFFRHAYGVPTSGVFHRLLPPQAVTISNVPQRGRLCV